MNMKNHIEDALQQYGEKLVSYEDLYNGSSNMNWKVHTSNGDYVLKRMPMHHPEKFIEFQNWLSSKLAETKIPFKPNVFTKSGDTVLVHNSYLWQLRPYVNGRFHKLGDRNDTKSCINVLLKLHSMDVDKNNNDTIEDFVYWTNEGEKKLKRSTEIIRKFVDNHTLSRMTKHYAALIKRSSESGYQMMNLKNVINHGDFHSRNLIFNDDGLSAVIDWDNSKIGPRVSDFAKAFYLLSRCMHNSFAINVGMAERFLAQYHNVAKLTKEEIHLIPLILGVAYIPKPEHLLSFGNNVDKLLWYINWTFNGSEMAECQLRPIIQKLIF